jgi:large subunit ribosomal protein L24
LLIKRDDTVVVIAGDDRGPERRRVLRVYTKTGKVVVEGVNRVYKHVRPNRRNPQGGRLSKEMPLSASNVMLYCERCGRGVRVGARYLDDGGKERFCKRCSSSLGTLAPARARHAKRA